MSTKKPVRVLVCGDVNGQFEQLIKRVSAVNKKNGPFDTLLCVGEFFGPDTESNQKVIDAAIEFPVMTYILGPCCPSTSNFYPEGSVEFSANLTYLGKKGILNTASGLQIAYLSGIEGSSVNSFQFTKDVVDELLMPVKASSGFLGVDILLTSMWPAQVSKFSSNQPSRDIDGSPLISRLAAGLKPRYHFAGMGSHYERSPYRNHRVLLEIAQHVTRFIGLAPVNNREKEKWLYAFSMTPIRKLSRAELIVQPPNTSEFPYMELIAQMILKEKAANVEESGTSDGNYRFDFSEEPEDNIDRGGRRRRRYDDEGPSARQPRVQQPCWFCLSNVDAEKYLVVSVADHCYVAMPKGPLTDDHIMILSIGHIQSIVAAPQEVRDEMQKYKDAFTLMFDKVGKVPVMFERNYKTQHLQLQIVPVPKPCSKALRSSFVNTAQLKNLDLAFLEKDQQIWDMVNEGCPYFYVELPDGTRLFSTKMHNFPLQFGREVLATRALLNCEDKIDWRSCELEKEEQTGLVKKLQQSFKPFDFTEDDEDSS